MGTTLTECLEFHREFAGGEDYDFVRKALELLRAGNSADALKTLEELEKNMFEEQLHESKMCLTHLIEHVILCRELPEKMREEGWLRKMWDCRDKIAYYMTVQPKINREYLESVWAECFERACYLAETYLKTIPIQLSWEQVFEEEYGNLITQTTDTNYGGK